MENQKSNDDRGISISRVFDAPVELMWEVWTNPDHIKNWWGPDGFTNTISKMEVQPEGEWNLVMHGPDGTNYKNRSVFREVVKYKKLVYEHFAPDFTATVEFESRGEKTYMHWQMVFESREEFLRVVKAFKADEGMKQNVEKLDRYLQNLNN